LKSYTNPKTAGTVQNVVLFLLIFYFVSQIIKRQNSQVVQVHHLEPRCRRHCRPVNIEPIYRGVSEQVNDLLFILDI